MGLRNKFAMPRPEMPLVIAIGPGPAVSVQKDWYLFLVSVYNGVTQGLPQPEVALTVGASPFTYQALIKGQVIISGGTVSAIAFSRDGNTFYSTGQIAGTFQLCTGDYLRVTHTVAPSAVFFPM
jgi:hypothetical protein